MKQVHRLIWLLCALSSPGLSLSKHERAKLDKIYTLVRPLPEHRLFYHWAKESKAKMLISKPTSFAIYFKGIMSFGTKIDNLTLHAGRGMYISERYDNSAKYGDILVEIHAAANTPYIDLTDDDTVEKMHQLGITRRDVFTLNPKVLIRFDKTHQWWVVKSREGLTFHPFHEPNALRLLRNRHKIIRKGGMDRFYNQSLPILRRNVITQYNGVRELSEAPAQPSLRPTPSQSLYMWRTDSSCGWYTRSYQLVQDDMPLEFCRNSFPTSYSWYQGQCRETVKGYPSVVINPEADRRHCPTRFRHRGKCAKLRGNNIVFIKDFYCIKAGL